MKGDRSGGKQGIPAVVQATQRLACISSHAFGASNIIQHLACAWPQPAPSLAAHRAWQDAAHELEHVGLAGGAAGWPPQRVRVHVLQRQQGRWQCAGQDAALYRQEEGVAMGVG